MQTLVANNSRILRIKNAKFSGYCFMWTQIYREIFKSALAYRSWKKYLKYFSDVIILASQSSTVFCWKNKYSEVLNGDVHGTSTGSRCETSWGKNYGTFLELPRDVGHTSFLNLTQKHIKLTLTGYSSIYSELL